ncbi:MAG: hydrogenase nickel incorporation protein HypB [Promethearchaeota archaeon]
MTEKKDTLKIIELNEDLISNNDQLARENQRILKEKEIRFFEVVGAIGAGKTALLEKIVEQLASKFKILVLNGDVTTRIDANRIEQYGIRSIQINTGRECALNSYHISQVIQNLDLNDFSGGILFVENVGNLICPSDFILGAEKRIVVVSITEGEWVVKKHPLLFKMSDLAVINKIDLQDILEVNIESMVQDALSINPNIKVICSSTETGEGIADIIEALGILP